MNYRDPDTGRFITQEQWENFFTEPIDEYEDWDDLEQWESFPEAEY